MKLKALLISLILFSPSPILARSGDHKYKDQKVESSQSSQASRLEVLIGDKADGTGANCQGYSNVVLNVPKGATVQVQTRDGDINIVAVASAYAATQNGDVNFEHVTRSIEACSLGGNVSLKDSTGRVNLSSAGGGLEATNIRPAESGDTFEAVSISGDITLREVSHAELNARTVNGNVNLAGPLALHGRYGFKTMSGDVTLSLPADASFRLVATVAQNGEIVTDFPLTLISSTTSPPRSPKGKTLAAPKEAPAAIPPVAPSPESPEPAPAPAPTIMPEGQTVVVKVTPKVKIVRVDPVIAMAPFASRRVNAIHGSGDASITVASFSGTVHLQKD